MIRFVIVCMIAAFLTGTTLSNAAEPARAVKEVYDSVKTAVRDHNGTPGVSDDDESEIHPGVIVGVVAEIRASHLAMPD